MAGPLASVAPVRTGSCGLLLVADRAKCRLAEALAASPAPSRIDCSVSAPASRVRPSSSSLALARFLRGLGRVARGPGEPLADRPSSSRFGFASWAAGRRSGRPPRVRRPSAISGASSIPSPALRPALGDAVRARCHRPRWPLAARRWSAACCRRLTAHSTFSVWTGVLELSLRFRFDSRWRFAPAWSGSSFRSTAWPHGP